MKLTEFDGRKRVVIEDITPQMVLEAAHRALDARSAKV